MAKGKGNRLKERGKTKNDLKERPSERKSTNQDTPWFCFNKLQNGHCISDCDQEQQAAVAETLRRLSQLTWNDINQAPRHGMGYEKIAQTAIKAAIPPAITEDVQLLAFRCHGLSPMIGYRFDRVFHLVWIDKSFDVYDHG